MAGNSNLEVRIRVALDEASIREVESMLESLKSKFEKEPLKINTTGLQQNQKEVGNSFENIGTNLTKLGKKISKTGKAMMVGLPFTKMIKDSVEFYAEIEKQQLSIEQLATELIKSKDSTLSWSQAEEKAKAGMSNLNKEAMKLASTTSLSTSEAYELAEGYTRAGLSLDETTSLLSSSGKAMIATQASAEEIIKATVVTMNGYQLSAKDTSKALDTLFNASNHSKLGFGEFTSGLGNCMSTMSNMGQSVETTAAAMTVLTNAGYSSSTAATGLASIMSRLTGENISYASSSGDLNVALKDENGNMRDLGDIMADLGKETENWSESDKLAMLTAVFGRQQARKAMDLLNPAFQEEKEALLESSQAFDEGSSAIERFYEKLSGGKSESIAEFSSKLEALKFNVGHDLADALEWCAEKLGKLIDYFNEHEGVRKFAEVALVVLGVLGALAPVVITVGGVVSALGGFFTLLGAAGTIASTAMTVVSTVLGALLSPIGLVVVGIGLLIVAIVECVKHWDEIKEAAGKCWEAIKNWFGNIGEWFSEKWQGVKTATSEAWQNVKDTIGEKVDKAKEAVEKGWGYIKDNVIAPVQTGIQQLIDGDWEGFKKTISDATEKIKGDISEKFEGAKQAVSNAMQGIKTEIEQKFNNAKESAKNAVTNLKESVSKKFEEMKESATKAVTHLKESVSKKFEEAKTSVTNAVNGIKESISKKFEEAKTSATNAVTNLKTSVSTAFQNLKSIIGTVVGGIVGDIKTSVGKWATEMKNGAERAISSCVSAFSGLGQKIMGAVSGVASTISGWWQGIKSIFSGGISASVNITKHVKEGSLSSSDMMTLDSNEFMSLDSSNNILTNSGMSLNSVGINTNNIRALDRQTTLLEEILEEISDKPQVVNTTVNCEVKNDIDINRLAEKIESHQKRALRKSGARLGIGY